jgi:hypothetical protein
MEIFIPIKKVDAAKREVYGLMAEEAVDKSNEIFDYESSKPYIKAWVEGFSKTTGGKSFGNVRAMHSSVAAGKLIGIGFDDKNKQIPVCAKIVDDNEWKKVEEGVYTGFSIGGKYVKKWSDGTATRYTADPSELSIVDNPCMRGAQFTMVKEDGSTELRKFAPAASTESLADLKKSINRQFYELTELVTKLVKKRMTESEAEKEFHPLAHGEVVKCFVDGIPARKELGHNPARNANILKSADGFTREVQPRSANSFAPVGVRKHDAKEAEAVELIKTARKNAKPPFAYR